MPQFRKVRPGQPLHLAAGDWNAAMAAAEAHRARAGDGPGQRRPGAGNLPAGRHGPNVVLVQNDSGADRDRFDILGIDSPLVGPTDNAMQFKSRVGLSGVTPAEDTHEGRFLVLAEPIADGKVGRAYIDGVCVCHVDVQDADDGYAEIADGDATKLTTGPSGSARILWKASGTGEQWAVIRFGVAAAAAETVLMEITGATAAALNGPGLTATEWTYSAKEVTEAVDASGELAYTDVSGGLTLTDQLLNRMEAGNRDVGSGDTYGNGIPYDDLDAADIDGQLQAIPTGYVVTVRLTEDPSGDTWGAFGSPNGVSVDCS